MSDPARHSESTLRACAHPVHSCTMAHNASNNLFMNYCVHISHCCSLSRAGPPGLACPNPSTAVFNEVVEWNPNGYLSLKKYHFCTTCVQNMMEGAMGAFQDVMLVTTVSLLLISVCSSDTSLQRSEDVHCDVEVDAGSVMATTDATFLCATLDWYPQDRCSYGICSWDRASILNLVSPPPDIASISWSRIRALTVSLNSLCELDPLLT